MHQERRRSGKKRRASMTASLLITIPTCILRNSQAVPNERGILNQGSHDRYSRCARPRPSEQPPRCARAPAPDRSRRRRRSWCGCRSKLPKCSKRCAWSQITHTRAEGFRLGGGGGGRRKGDIPPRGVASPRPSRVVVYIRHVVWGRVAETRCADWIGHNGCLRRVDDMPRI